MGLAPKNIDTGNEYSANSSRSFERKDRGVKTPQNNIHAIKASVHALELPYKDRPDGWEKRTLTPPNGVAIVNHSDATPASGIHSVEFEDDGLKTQKLSPFDGTDLIQDPPNTELETGEMDTIGLVDTVDEGVNGINLDVVEVLKYVECERCLPEDAETIFSIIEGALVTEISPTYRPEQGLTMKNPSIKNLEAMLKAPDSYIFIKLKLGGEVVAVAQISAPGVSPLPKKDFSPTWCMDGVKGARPDLQESLLPVRHIENNVAFYEKLCFSSAYFKQRDVYNKMIKDKRESGIAVSEFEAKKYNIIVDEFIQRIENHLLERGMRNIVCLISQNPFHNTPSYNTHIRSGFYMLGTCSYPIGMTSIKKFPPTTTESRYYILGKELGNYGHPYNFRAVSSIVPQIR